MDKVPAAAVIGYPLKHSLSPEIFHFLSKKLKRNLNYSKIAIPPKDFKRALSNLREPGFLGCNVTIPYKERSLEQVDVKSPEVKILGASNVLHQFKAGKWKAYNTDIFGIEKTLSEQDFSIKGKTALVFGSGGAAKAVLYVLGKQKAKNVTIVNRTLKNAQDLANKMQNHFPQTEFTASPRVPEEHGNTISLWVNSTPVGMAGFPQDRLLPPDVSFLSSKNGLAFDLVYNPSKTPFIVAAKKAKLKTINGLDMLIWQALKTWEIWFGKIHNPNPIKKQLKKRLTQKLKGYARS